ncbi:MAG: glycine cleavage system protein GcvH [Steroidobacteraceae bacterium]
MSLVPNDLKYTRTHEWLRERSDGSIEVGITDHAQQALGDLVFVELPESGRQLARGEACAVVESVKAASDVYSPIAGTVSEGNDALAASPELINQDPYGAGWMLRFAAGAELDPGTVISAGEYEALLASETA